MCFSKDCLKFQIVFKYINICPVHLSILFYIANLVDTNASEEDRIQAMNLQPVLYLKSQYTDLFI